MITAFVEVCVFFFFRAVFFLPQIAFLPQLFIIFASKIKPGGPIPAVKRRTTPPGLTNITAKCAHDGHAELI